MSIPAVSAIQYGAAITAPLPKWEGKLLVELAALIVVAMAAAEVALSSRGKVPIVTTERSPELSLIIDAAFQEARKLAAKAGDVALMLTVPAVAALVVMAVLTTTPSASSRRSTDAVHAVS